MTQFSWIPFSSHKAKPVRKAKRRDADRRLVLEILESRIAPAIVAWDGGGGNFDWSNRFNWNNLGAADSDTLPDAGDDAVIDVAGISVTHSAGIHSVQSLTINDPFTLSGGTLIVTGNLVQQNSNRFTLAGGTLKSATVVGGGGAVLVAARGTLDGVTLGGTFDGVPIAATVQVNEQAITVTGGLTFANGSLLDLSTHMTLVGAQNVLGGDGEILFQSVGGTGAQINTTNQTTFGPGLTIHRVDTSTNDIFMNGGTLTNQATIRADAGGKIRVTGAGTFLNGVGGVLAADGGTLDLTTTWSNAGRIVVNNSTINLGGSFTTAGLGAFTRTGGTINLVGLLDNTNQLLSLDASRGSWNLAAGGTLRQGSLVTSSGAVLAVAGTLDGVTLGATVSGLPWSATVQSSDNFDVIGGLTFANGSVVDVNNHTMRLMGDQTVGGDGEIRLRGGIGNISTRNQTLFGPGLTIHRGDASSSVITLIDGTIMNHATIRADAGGQILLGNSGATTFTNAADGMLSAVGGTLIVTNTTNFAAGTLTGGTWQAIGNGILRIVGADITTNAATILLDGVGARLTRDQPGASALTHLSTNTVEGSFTVRNVANFLTAGSFSNNGALTLGPAGTFTTNGTFSQGNSASLAVEIGGAPTSGLFGRLVTNGQTAFDGTLDVRLVNGYGPGPGLDFPILSYASRSGDFATTYGLTVADVALFDPEYDATHLTLTSLALATDLVFVSANPPASIVPGQPVSVPYTVRNLAGTPVTGDWTDSLYLSTDGVLDPSDVLLGRFEHQGGVNGNASYVETLTAIVPAMAEGNYHVIVLADSRHRVPQGNHANDVGASVGSTALRVPILNLGAPISDTIANGEDRYYKLVVPPGKDLKINVDFAAALQAELYLRHGGLPDRNNFDQTAPSNELHPALVVANPLGDATFYVLLHGGNGAAGARPFTLTAATVGFEIISLGTKSGSNRTFGSIGLIGSRFTPQTTVTLQRPGVDSRTSQSVTFADSTHLTAEFDLKGLPTGSYTVSAIDAGQTAVALDTFTVTNDPAGLLSLTILTPETVRVGGRIIVTIHVRNPNNAEAFGPYIVVNAGGVDAGQTHEERGTPPDELPGLMRPLGEKSIGIQYRADPKGDGNRSDFDLTVLNPYTTLIDWDNLKDSYRPTTIPIDAWDAIWANLRPGLGSTLADMFALLRRDSNALAELGIDTREIHRLFDFEIRKANDLPALPVPAGAMDLNFPAPGLPLVFGRSFGPSIADRFHVGRLGRGWVDNLDLSIGEDASGSLATVRQGSGLRAFARKSDGSYESFPGDHATLTKVNGAFRLTEKNGATIAFRADGLLDYLEDTTNNRLTAGYSGTQMTTLKHSNGSFLKLVYNVQNRIILVTDPAGRTATYAYDASGEHLVSVTTSDGVTEYAYASEATGPKAHALASISYRDGTHLFFAYDSHGRLARQERDGGAQALTFTYDAASFDVTDALGRTLRSYFDDTGRVRAMVDPLARIVTMNYDNDNNLVSAFLANNQPTRYDYDAQGNLIGALDPLGQHQEFDHESTFYNLTQWRDALDHATDFTYDSSGNLLAITSADGASTQFAYDAQGNVASSVNRRGQTITYTYDSRGLLTRKDLPDGAHDDYAYDNRGNMLSATDAAGATVMDYDLADRLTKITYPTGRSLEYTYDAAGRHTRTRDQDGFTVNYRFDEVGRLAELADGQGQRIVAYGYDASGRQNRETRGNGTVTTYEYDEAGELLHLIHFAPDATVVSQFDYVYDNLGRRKSMTTLEGETQYGYDAGGRLTSVALPGGRAITYEYDAAGNRKTVTDNGASTGYTVNELNQYLTIGAASQGFDADGDQISSNDGSRNYAYDAQGRLVSIVTPQGTWTYEYDALGNRVASTHNGVQTQYLIDPSGLGNVAAEYDGSGNLRAHYVHGAGLVSRIDAAGPTAYYQFDAAGNTAQLTGAGGAVLNTYSYLPFGERLTSSETVSNPFTYVGQFGVMSEGNGLDYMRNRWYDPVQGRFTQEDAIGLSGGPNLYAYVGNNPVASVDPTGLLPSAGLLVEGIFLTTPGVGGVSAAFGTTFPGSEGAAADLVFREAGAMNAAERAALGVSSTGSAGINANPLGNSVGGQGGISEQAFRAGQAQLERTLAQRAAIQAIGRGFAYGFIAAGVAIIAFEAFYFGESVAEIFGADTPECLPVVPRFFQPDCKEPPGADPVPGGHTFTIQRNPSIDPNDIVGPAGVGAGRFVANGILPYSILFENKPEAEGPAALVVVTQRLDDDLDLDTFTFGDFGFGDVNVSVPEGRQFFGTRLDLRATRGVFVDVAATLDRPTRVVTWILTALDPETLDLVSDISVGFLPPDKNQPEGQGYVNYFVGPKAGSPTGTRIDAQATIVFDANAPIDTPAIFNTIDTGPPISRVSVLAATTADPNFLVSAAGSDDAGGSGIGTFEIYVSDNGASFTLWQSVSDTTPLVYPGVIGHTYGFYSVATDNVDHRETTPAGAQASITVVSTPPSSSVNAMPAHQDSAVIAISWTGQQGAGGAEINGYDIFISDNGAAFAPLLQNVAVLTTTYTGAYGHVYGFYSIAHDAIHAEAAPGVADATIVIDAFVPTQVPHVDAGRILRFYGTTAGPKNADVVFLQAASDAKHIQITYTAAGKKIVNKAILLSDFDAIHVFGGDGDDALTITNLAKPVYAEGGNGNDMFTVVNPTKAVTFEGGAGTDRLIVNGNTAAANTFVLNGATLTVNGFAIILGGCEAVTVGGQSKNDTFAAKSVPALPVVTFAGGGGTDTVIVANMANTWNLTDAGAGTLNGTLLFNTVENLTGGADRDTFLMNIVVNGKKKTTGKLTGKINGGAGDNTLDYSAWTAAVTVDFNKGTATNAGGVSGISIVIGGSGADKLTAKSTGSVLLGDAGTDTLKGSAGRDILIGGSGGDTLDGAGGEDILIAGLTAYHDETTGFVGKSALMAILAEWRRTDLSYVARSANLRAGTGDAGGNRLDATTVFDDAPAKDTLTGGIDALDWFFANPLTDVFRDRDNPSAEQVN